MRKVGVSLSIEFTNHCNLRCIYCPHPSWGKGSSGGTNVFDRPKGYITEVMLERALRMAHDYAAVVSLGFFGEMQLHPRFHEFVRRVTAKPRPYRVTLNSNWTLVTPEDYDVLRTIDEVRISIDSSNAATWEKMCPGGPVFDLDGSKGTDRHATLVRKVEHWLSVPHPHTQLILVRMPHNSPEEAAHLAHWQSLAAPADLVIGKAWLSYGGQLTDPTMPARDCQTYRQDKVMFSWDGNLSTCNMDVNMAMTFGNAVDDPDLRNHMTSNHWKHHIERMRTRQGICAVCPDAQNHSQRVLRGRLPVL